MQHGWRENERDRHCMLGYISRLPSCYVRSEVFPVDELWHFELAGDPSLVPLVPEIIRSTEPMD